MLLVHPGAVFMLSMEIGLKLKGIKDLQNSEELGHVHLQACR